jgi:hypothetical protein
MIERRYRISIVVTGMETGDGSADPSLLNFETAGAADFIHNGDALSVESSRWDEIDSNGRALGGL